MGFEAIAPDSPVTNEEILYRAVSRDPRMFPDDGHGARRISTMAFNDPGRRPSVDRAVLCPRGPEDTRRAGRIETQGGVRHFNLRFEI